MCAVPGSSQAAVYTFIGARDIATSGSNDTATANVILGQPSSAIVWTAGDNAYNSGTLAEYQTHYAPTWGQFYGRTWPNPWQSRLPDRRGSWLLRLLSRPHRR
jgi:hypothetical protein